MIHIQVPIRIARHAPGHPVVTRSVAVATRDARPAIDACGVAGHSGRLKDLIDEIIMVALAVLPAAMSTAIMASASCCNLVR